jgi:3-oxoacyl-[acyl-carrier protein] reductase
MCARHADLLTTAASDIERSTGTPVRTRAADVLQDAGRQTVIETALQTFGHVDILVNNCGGPRPGGFKDTLDPSDWQDAFERSLMQVVRWTQAVVPHMKGGGRIVNIVSAAVKQPIDGLLLSNSIRPGVVGFCKTVSRELAPLGITINCVLPGYIRTDRMLEIAAARSAKEGIGAEEVLAGFARDIPVGRLGDPAEVGALVAFLCSTQAAFITGTTHTIDGGMVRSLL